MVTRYDQKISKNKDDTCGVHDKRSQGVCCRGTRLVFPLPRDMGVEINYRSSIRVLGPGGDPVTCAITDHH